MKLQGTSPDLILVSQNNIAATQVNYNIKPSFNFAFDANSAVSSRTRSKTSNQASATPAIQSTVRTEKGELNAKPPRNTSAPQSKLPKLLEHILPLDIHARLAKELRQCVASLVENPSQKCTNQRASGQSLKDILGVLVNLAGCQDEEDYCGMLGYIEKLVRESTCRKHRNVALQQPEAKSRLEQLRELLKDTKEMGEVDRSIFTSWIDVISNPNASIKHIQWIYSITTTPKATPKPKLTLAVYLTPTTVSSSSNFIPYQRKDTRGLSVFSALHNKATSPLGKKDTEDGFIYLFWDMQHFGKVKIGYTKDLTKRLKQWNRQCNRDHLYHPNDGFQIEMKHVHRVEELIHTELKEFRRQRRCEGCGRMHEEWFEVPEAHAVKVASKWRDWILQKPYVQDAVTRQWAIRPDMLDTLEHICEPMPQEVSIQSGRRRSERVQRLSLKKNHA